MPGFGAMSMESVPVGPGSEHFNDCWLDAENMPYSSKEELEEQEGGEAQARAPCGTCHVSYRDKHFWINPDRPTHCRRVTLDYGYVLVTGEVVHLINRAQSCAA